MRALVIGADGFAGRWLTRHLVETGDDVVSAVGPHFAGHDPPPGEVVAVGPGVTEIKAGDRVAYVAPLGGYAAERLLPAERAVKLPQAIVRVRPCTAAWSALG